MKAPLALVAPLLFATVVAVAQERTRDKKPPTFAELHAAVKTQFDSGSYGQAYGSARELLTLIGVKRADAIRAAMPAAPEGYEIVPQKKEDEAARNNPLLGAMTAGVGNIIEQEYRGSKGTLRITATADSPMMAMAKMMFDNPAMLGADAELIKYEQCKGILKKEGRQWQLQILIEDTMVDAKFGSEDDDFALKMFDQAAVNALHRAIAD